MSTPAPDDRPADSPTAGAAGPLAGRPAGVPAGTPYHRLAHLREAWARPARPVLTALVAIIAYVVLASILLVAVVTVLALAPGSPQELGTRLSDPASPLAVLVTLAMGALWIPAALIGVRFGGWRPVRWLLGVVGSFRWDLVRSAAVPVVAASVLGTVLVALLVAGLGGGVAAEPAAIGPAILAGILATVLGIAKAVGAELALRGVLLQAIGTWLRSPVLTIGLAALVSLAAASYSAPGLVIAAAMGVACGYLAWRSGGLELPVLLTASLTAGGGIVAVLLRIVAGSVALGAAEPASGAPLAAEQLGRTATGAASIPGVASATVPGAIGIGLLALVIAALLGRWIGRREQLAAAEPVRRPADAPAPQPVAV